MSDLKVRPLSRVRSSRIKDIASSNRCHPGEDGKPGRVGGDVQIVIEQAVDQEPAASKGGAETNPATLGL